MQYNNDNIIYTDIYQYYIQIYTYMFKIIWKRLLQTVAVTATTKPFSELN